MAMAQRKRGRPVKVYEPDPWEAVRTAKRIALVQGGDPALAENPLGILFARGQIDQDQRNAGDLFGKLYARAQGRLHMLGFDPGLGEMGEDAQARAEAQYVECRALLLKDSRRCFDEVCNVCVYRRLPNWVKPFRYARPSFERDKAALKTGLDLLVGCLIGRKATR